MALWKPINMPGIPGRFQACDEGIIKTTPYVAKGHRNGQPFDRHMPERILKPRINKQSPSLGRHPVVGIYVGSSRKHCVHREIRVAKLVAVAFYGLPFNPSDQREIQRWRIRFRDGDLLNCTALNLEWVYSAGSTVDEHGVKAQTTYEKNLDTWEAQKSQPVSAVLSRLFGDAYAEENAA